MSAGMIVSDLFSSSVGLAPKLTPPEEMAAMCKAMLVRSGGGGGWQVHPTRSTARNHPKARKILYIEIGTYLLGELPEMEEKEQAFSSCLPLFPLHWDWSLSRLKGWGIFIS